ncbi:hydroxyisourate hydrolase [Sphingobacterium puteale]|uniref:5-hydroxyisourate hydrolase n=1 Tax=Sphingobacterium puteale TaxID=2420510 RepID=A0A420VUV8_9SPHI|nr:hydroxyisourate hydrolase [Sphingobacterium puteale]RKO70150.1 hydroxyisourate hydrolase [Sphingobacterium puteale]
MNRKKYFIMLFCVLFGLTAYGQNSKYQLSSHILDISKGSPAPNVQVDLERLMPNKQWTSVASEKTDSNGRISNFLLAGEHENKGIYKLKFYTGSYFLIQSLETFYPFIEVVFEIKDEKHYHVPITISPFGYSTYRGS